MTCPARPFVPSMQNYNCSVTTSGRNRRFQTIGFCLEEVYEEKGKAGAALPTIDLKKIIMWQKSTTLAAALISVVNSWGSHGRLCDLLLLLLLQKLLLQLPVLLLQLLLLLHFWRLSDERGSSGIIFLLFFLLGWKIWTNCLVLNLNCSCCFVFSFLGWSRMEKCHWLPVVSLRLQQHAINRHSRKLSSCLRFRYWGKSKLWIENDKLPMWHPSGKAF